MSRLKTRHARILALEDLLIAKPGGAAVVELATELKVNRRTIYRDLEFLGEIGAPVWEKESRYGILGTYKQAEYKKANCVWIEDEDFGYWQTSCKQEFGVNEGTPSENGMRFCAYCGRPLKEMRLP